MPMPRDKSKPTRRAATGARAPRRGTPARAPKSRMLAKLSRPATSGMLPRPRLFEAIGRSGASIVWVSGPPGAGKTTLLSSYTAARARPVLWYQLDGGDNDPAAFFYYLREAVAPRRRAALPLLTPEYLPDLQSFARRYFRAL